ncbi:MAG: hypothetical protein ABI855_00695 [Bacteroidota bacterium]
MKKITTVSLLTGLMLIASGAFSREILTNVTNHKSVPAKVSAGCSQTTAQKDLDYNNVRARIFVGGDMWWDLVGSPQYEIPKGSGKTSSFAASIWIGGLDPGGNIKAAAQNYRQSGNDYWGGPIQLADVSITSDRCNEFDRQWKIRKQDVASFKKNPDFDTPNPDAVQSKLDIFSWPGTGGPGEEQYLAPYHDGNGDGIYDPRATDATGLPVDYPNYNFSGLFSKVGSTTKVVCDEYIFGDQTIWWVFNDVGSVKTNTNSPHIGLEIRAQAFSFKTNDAINDMTFYKYQIINRSSQSFTQTYFGQWADCDLGYYNDDFVRCNVKLGLGMTYNGDLIDDLPDGYGATPPVIGVDFFQGPKADLTDGVDNDRDGCIDCTYLTDSLTGQTLTIMDTDFPEQIIMAKFVYYNNNNDPVNGEPNLGPDYYNYLKGIWKNNVKMTYGGDGTTGTDTCDFMFPGSTDTVHFQSLGTWTEETVVPPNTPLDRRMIQSAGPFTLLPGATNYITVGAVWARATSGDNTASIAAVEKADIKAQALFDNCFKTLDGPDAPDLVIRELDKALIFSLQNTDNENIEHYDERDPTITDSGDTHFRFQGYQVYQLKTSTGGISDLENHPDDIKLVFQCDIKDGIAEIVNYTIAPYSALTAVSQVSGADKGITHTFKVDRDLFATSNNALVNHKNYYYTVVSYAYNNYKTFDPLNPLLGGQLKPYLAGRNNIITYSAIPHIISPENGGTVLNSDFGDGPVITRFQGQGNGGMVLDFTQSTIDEILSSSEHRSRHPQYVGGKGPIDVRVYDPILVRALDFTNKFDGISGTSHWTMFENGSGIAVKADTTISQPYEQVFSTDHKQLGSNGTDLPLNWGITANIHTVLEPGNLKSSDNGFLEATISYKDNTAKWINFLPNSLDIPNEHWITSVSLMTSQKNDSLRIYENVLGGTWAPLAVCAAASSGSIDSLMPKPPASHLNNAQIALSPGSLTTSEVGISSIDIVFTNDQSKWSRAAVVEMGNKTPFTIGNAVRFDLRKSNSIDKSGNMNYPSTDNNDFPTGMGWFPGYAYNLETGERLNIVYGENSALSSISATVDSAFGNGSDITYFTNAPHPFVSGQQITITGLSPSGFNTSFAMISSIPTDTTFKINGALTGSSTGIALAVVQTGNNVENGTDMKWNPSENAYNNAGKPVFGGMHYIYVFGRNLPIGAGVPVYDGCRNIHDSLIVSNSLNQNPRRGVWKEGMWVSIPMLKKGNTLNQTDVTVRLRVAKTYRGYNPDADANSFLKTSNTLQIGEEYIVVRGNAIYNGDTIPIDRSFTTVSPFNTFTSTNNGVVTLAKTANPIYNFNTYDLAASLSNSDAAKDALKLVNVVPNPYYAYSAYEGTANSNGSVVAGQLDSRIKIVNLPAKCTISIFTMHGALIKRFIRDVPENNSEGGDYQETSVDWDLKNTQGIAIASGIYLIHVDAGTLGQRTLKWFGVLRPIDVGVY